MKLKKRIIFHIMVCGLRETAIPKTARRSFPGTNENKKRQR